MLRFSFQINKMPAHINRQTAPRKSRRILDVHHRRREPRARHTHQLQKRLQPMHRSQRIRRRNLRSRSANIQHVTLVLAQFLHRLARALRMNHQSRFASLRNLRRNKQSCPPRKLAAESFRRAHEARLAVTLDPHRKRRRDPQRPASHPHPRRHRHQIQFRRGLLRGAPATHESNHHHQQKNSHLPFFERFMAQKTF